MLITLICHINVCKCCDYHDLSIYTMFLRQGIQWCVIHSVKTLNYLSVSISYVQICFLILCYTVLNRSTTVYTRDLL